MTVATWTTPEQASMRARIHLPLVTLYLTERCNSRCITCDYWRTGRDHLSLTDVRRQLPALERMGTRLVVLSGGEPLLNPQWREIARELSGRGMKLWLLSSGLSLAKHAARVAELFEFVTVSLDGADAATYRAIRGLDAFGAVCAGIRASVHAGSRVGIRVTLQKSNYRQIHDFVRLARALGVSQLSFLAVDVSNPHAFGRDGAQPMGLVLDAAETAELGELIEAMEVEFADEFARRFIAEPMSRLRHILAYFAALAGRGAFPPVRCNAPEFSAVVGVHGDVAPCFFIAGPARGQDADLEAMLSGDAFRSLRADIQAGRRPECQRCVCSLWRAPNEWPRGVEDLSSGADA